MGHLYVQGIDIDWAEYDKPYNRQKVLLPTYPFQRERYWIDFDPRGSQRDDRALELSDRAGCHPMLFKCSTTPYYDDIYYETNLALDYPHFIKGHQFFGIPIVAAASYLSSFIDAAYEVLDVPRILLKDIQLKQAIVIPDYESVRYQVVVREDAKVGYRVEAFSQVKGSDFVQNVQSTVKGVESSPTDYPSLESLKEAITSEISSVELTEELASLGISLNENYQWLTTLCKGENAYLGRLRKPLSAEERDGFMFYPGMMDMGFQLGMQLLNQAKKPKEGFYIHSYLESFYFDCLGSAIEWLYVEHRGSDEHSYIDIFYYDGRGGLVGSVKKLSGVPITESIMHRMLRSSHSEPWYYQSRWIKDDFDAYESLSKQDLVLVLSDGSLMSKTLIDDLERCSIPNEVLNQSSLAKSFNEDEGFNTDVLETVLIDF